MQAVRASPGIKRAAPTSTVEHLPKRPKLESMQRFSTASEAELTKLSKPFVPKKTEDATAWSLRNFHCWLRAGTAKTNWRIRSVLKIYWRKWIPRSSTIGLQYF